ncbi:MAG: NADH-quinone oxidoreductase subunit NuoK [Bacteroidota bacterium]|jgi:NADH:ubiquinone oxidoreductase subunit K
MITLHHYLLISALLFCIGLFAVITKRNAIMMLMGIELMLNAANINLVVFSKFDALMLQGQMFALFVIVVAASEAAVGLAIILRVYGLFKTANLDEIDQLKH